MNVGIRKTATWIDDAGAKDRRVYQRGNGTFDVCGFPTGAITRDELKRQRDLLDAVLAETGEAVKRDADGASSAPYVPKVGDVVKCDVHCNPDDVRVIETAPGEGDEGDGWYVNVSEVSRAGWSHRNCRYRLTDTYPVYLRSATPDERARAGIGS